MPRLSKTVGLVFLLILLSRILLPSISPAFFDSPEYLRLFENPNFLDSLRQAHNPIHPLFLLIFWLFDKVPLGTTLLRAEFLNGIFGFLTTVIIYKISRSLVVTLFVAFTPYFWLSQINVLYEPLLGLLLALSFYYSKNLHFSAIFFALAFLVSSTTLIYLLPLFAWLLAKRSASWRTAVLIFGAYLLGALAIYAWVLNLKNAPLANLPTVLSGANNLIDKIRNEGWLFFPRVVRNMAVIYFNYLTIPLGLACLVLGLRKRSVVLVLSWLLAFFLLNSIWHAGMYGRLSLALMILPLFLLVRIKNRILVGGLLVLLLIQSTKLVVPYHFQEVPYWREKKLIENLDGRPLLIISNYEEPYLKGKFDYLVLNSPQTDEVKIKAEIAAAKKHHQPVLITSQAVSAPYHQYDGMNFHLLSGRPNYPETFGQKIATEFDLKIIIL